jgi:hypothetical protein
LISRSILDNLRNKKIDVFVRDLGQYSHFQGILYDITEEMILLKSKYNKISYIPLSEIVIVTEHQTKIKPRKAKSEDISLIHSSLQH